MGLVLELPKGPVIALFNLLQKFDILTGGGPFDPHHHNSVI